MSNTIQPTIGHAAFYPLAPRYHRALHRSVPTTKRKGTVRLCGGPLVKVDTLAQLERWQRKKRGLTAGQLLDKLTAHAQGTNFSPLP